uniref:Uncharacterized protein n=1 Tax=Oryza rufipogon TaxID=4529 RepID=A0A0E0RCN7_ORYRU
MRFLGWYLKIAAGGAAIGAAMELFMIHTGFYEKGPVKEVWKCREKAAKEGTGGVDGKKHGELRFPLSSRFRVMCVHMRTTGGGRDDEREGEEDHGTCKDHPCSGVGCVERAEDH